MDILYIVGEGSKHDNAELRWSLRSLAKHGRNVARVLVAGCPPAWLSGDVESLTVPDVDLPGKKNRSIVNCVLEAVRSFDLKGDFIFACDDVFLAEPVDFDRYPLYIDDDGLPEAPPSHRSDPRRSRYGHRCPWISCTQAPRSARRYACTGVCAPSDTGN